MGKAGVVKSVVENVKKFADNALLIPVTNPLDPMAYITYKTSGFEKSRVFFDFLEVFLDTLKIVPGHLQTL